MLNLTALVISGIFLLSLATQTWAAEFLTGLCPKNLTAVANLDMDKYAGRWYKYMETTKTNTKCEYCDIERDESGGYTYTKHVNSHLVEQKKYKILEVDAQGGRFVVDSFVKMYKRGIETYVLDTDYENFAIQYHCFEAQVLHYSYISLLTRIPIPTAETVNKLESLTQLSNIDMATLRKVSQIGCPTPRKLKTP